MTATTDTNLVVKLREKTGAGMMDCKKALTEAGGDLDKAVEILRKKGISDAAKKSARSTKEGAVAGNVRDNGRTGALIEVNCETDFVAKTDDFQKLVSTLAEDAASNKLTKVEDAAAQLQAGVTKLGENLGLKRFVRFELKGPGLVAFYVHPSGRKVGAMVELGASSDDVASKPEVAEAAKSILFQIAGAPASPRFLKREEVPAAEVEKEKEIHAEILKKEGKPEASIPKIVEGKLNKLFYQQIVLMEQVSILDNKTPIKQIVEEAGKKAGGTLTVNRFVRYQVGAE